MNLRRNSIMILYITKRKIHYGFNIGFSHCHDSRHFVFCGYSAFHYLAYFVFPVACLALLADSDSFSFVDSDSGFSAADSDSFSSVGSVVAAVADSDFSCVDSDADCPVADSDSSSCVDSDADCPAVDSNAFFLVDSDADCPAVDSGSSFFVASDFLVADPDSSSYNSFSVEDLDSLPVHSSDSDSDSSFFSDGILHFLKS